MVYSLANYGLCMPCNLVSRASLQEQVCREAKKQFNDSDRIKSLPGKEEKSCWVQGAREEITQAHGSRQIPSPNSKAWFDVTCELTHYFSQNLHQETLRFSFQKWDAFFTSKLGWVIKLLKSLKGQGLPCSHYLRSNLAEEIPIDFPYASTLLK